MRIDKHELWKGQFAGRADTASIPEMARAPLSALNFLSEAQVKELGRHGIETVGQLAKLQKPTLITELQLDPALMEKLICLLSHPRYDPGPNCAWERLFLAAPLDYYINYPNQPFHVRFGPVFYRGRLDGSARVLVLGQDPATDETLAQRAFVGQAGQLAQNFLTKLGLTRSYLMFNTFLYGAQSGSLNDSMTTDVTIMGYRNKLFDRAASTNQLTAILTFGNYAYDSAMNWPGRGTLPVIRLMHPSAPNGVAANWNMRLAEAHAAITPDANGHVDVTPYDTGSPMPATDIPRRDLPFGIPSWHGTGGHTHSQRVSGNFETQITWTAP